MSRVNPKTRDPSTVFTPRGDTINEMYIARFGLEDRLRQYIPQSMHIVLHGESGCGKTWLYKKVFADTSVYYRTANLGRACTQGINGLLAEVLAKIDNRQLTEIAETKGAGVNLSLFEAGLEAQKTYSVRQGDVFELLLQKMRAQAGSKRPAALVFENLEHILNDESAVNELKGLLLLLDDGDYAKYKIRIVLVTTASNFRTYLSSVGAANTLINRIKEVPEVGRLTQSQAETFVKRGLFQLLGIGVSPGDCTQDWLVHQVINFSDRIPQYMHELCLEIALTSEASGRTVTRELLTRAVAAWVKGSIVSEITAVTSNLNSKATKKGRKNQLLYAIALCKDSEFDYVKIEKIVRQEFPAACEGVKLNVSQGLSELADAKIALIRKNPNGTSYRIVDPRHRILMRWMLYKEKSSEILSIRDFDDGVSLS
ncbi:AAA family ATPase [Pseudoxanthomonas dokdonensis]|uniref:AAA family ATPase n=1 Tax=Pseudoxanthomonas dokdonensis TaxID=344882 RepID=UPI0009FAB5AE|nr:AAA family ATPase [Pseudoxanthomonas dokdonensis]